MSVKFRLHKDKSEGTKRSGKWYARMVPVDCVDTKQLAEIIQRNCTVKKADVMAVLTELVETMKDQMQDSKRVKLDGFGSFKIGVDSTGAATAEAFEVRKHIKGVHVVFTPERHTDRAGNKVYAFLSGTTVEELPLNTVEKVKP